MKLSVFIPLGIFFLCVVRAHPTTLRSIEDTTAGHQQFNLSGILDETLGLTENLLIGAKEASQLDLPQSFLNDTFSYLPSEGRNLTFAGKIKSLFDAAILHDEDKVGDLLTHFISFAFESLKPTSLAYDFKSWAKLSNSSNVNNRKTNTVIYPKADEGDAPYSLREDELREALKFHDDFQYTNSSNPTVLFVPGTGSYGGEAYYSNLAKLLINDGFTNIAYLNIPNKLLMDIQINGEYVAYAINYMSGVTGGRNISIVSWSQGGPATQWGLKYWPSTRKHISSFIPFSPDLQGTKIANFVFPHNLTLGGPPSVLQQRYESNFMQTLRKNGGDSALVPTTSIYSGTDFVVIPQIGKNASAYFKSDNGIKAENYQVQEVCANKPAGTYYSHEGVMLNPIAYALLMDALTYGGTAQLDRIDVEKACSKAITDGLTFEDFATTQLMTLSCGISILDYDDRVKEEPKIMSYAS